jgi:hypothetical protein
VIHYRPFRNSDPPALAEIWRSQEPLHRLAQPMSAALWEQFILAKTYFDAEGLIVATDGARPIGFVHAGFGPTEHGDQLDRSHGVVCRLQVGPHEDRPVVMTELLSAAEHYLSQRGAHDATAGNLDPLGPFYLGMYGSALQVGVLKSDPAQLGFFREHDYESRGERIVLQKSLSGYRCPVNRDQMQHRRAFEVSGASDPLGQTWWEACTTSHLDRDSFQLTAKCNGQVVAAAVTAHLQSLGQAWGVQAAGFESVTALSEAWQNGAALLLVAEAMKALQCQGVMLFEAVVDDLNSPLARVLVSLGFCEVDRGVVLKKILPAAHADA